MSILDSSHDEVRKICNSDWVLKLASKKKFHKSIERCLKTVTRYGYIFNNQRPPTAEEEESFYVYHFGDLDSEYTFGKRYIPEGSHEWIATALCVFASSAKYLMTKRTNQGIDTPWMNGFLKQFPLGTQWKKCVALLETVLCPDWNSYEISKMHVIAYTCVLYALRFSYSEVCTDCRSDIKVGNVRRDFGKNAGYLAASSFVKVNFVSHFKNGFFPLKCYQEVIKYEPNYYYWHYMESSVPRTAIKGTREYLDLVDFADSAYKYAPQRLRLTALMQLLCLEQALLKYCASVGWPDDVCEMLDVEYTNAFNEPWDTTDLRLKLATLKMAEFYIRYGTNEEHVRKGKWLLECCQTKWPNCSLVYGALAKLHYDASGSSSSSFNSKGKQIGPSTRSMNLFRFDLNERDVCNKRRNDQEDSTNKSKSCTKEERSTKAEIKETAAATVKSVVRAEVYTIAANNSVAGPSAPRKLKVPKKMKEEEVRKPKSEIDTDTAEFLNETISGLKVESVPVWAARYIEKIPARQSDLSGGLVSYLLKRLRQREFRMPENCGNPFQNEPSDECDDDDGNADENVLRSLEYEISSSEWLCTKICVVAMHVILKRPTKNILKSYWVALNEATTLSENHRKVYKYLLQASELCIKVIQVRNGGNHKVPTAEQEVALKKQIEKMQTKWKEVSDTAVVHYVKGRLACLLGLVLDISQGHYKKAVQQESNFYLWHKVTYETLKQMRKSGTNQHRPSSTEIQACQRALELMPTNPKIAIDLATLKMQSLLLSKRDECHNSLSAAGSSNKVLEVLEISGILSDALKICPSNSRCEMLAKIALAELYTAKDVGLLRVHQGEKLFTECYKKWPKSSVVLHKVGKFYHYTTSDFSKAVEIYEEGLKACPQNYPCLMDCLKLYGKHLKKYKEMVGIIDLSLPVIHEVEHVFNLIIIKGQACWLQSKKNGDMKKVACQVWAKGLKNHGRLALKLRDSLTFQTSPIFGRIDIQLADVRTHLKAAMTEENVHPIKIIDDFINGVYGTATAARYSATRMNTRSRALNSRPVNSSRNVTVFDLLQSKGNTSSSLNIRLKESSISKVK